MTDPRTTLSNVTITGVTSASSTIGEIYPRTTSTPLDELRKVKVEGLYTEISQAPTVEGKIVIFFNPNFRRVAQIYVAISINGTLEWRIARYRSRVINLVNRPLPAFLG